MASAEWWQNAQSIRTFRHTEQRSRSDKQYEGLLRAIIPRIYLILKYLDYSDTGTYWLRNYESETFKDDIEGLWQTLKPFYQQLHAYVRAKLRAHYGEDKVPKNQPIPAHLLGNMWAQMWGNINDLVTPYPGKSSVDVTPEMLKQVVLNYLLYIGRGF